MTQAVESHGANNKEICDVKVSVFKFTDDMLTVWTTILEFSKFHAFTLVHLA